MSKSLGNHIGITESPGEIYGRTLSLPDEAMEAWFELLAVERPPAGTGPRDAKHALARALVERFHGADAAAAAAEHFARVHVAALGPGGDRRARGGRRQRDGPPAGGDRRGLRDVALGCSAVLAQGGVRLDGEPLAATDLDLPRERLDGAVLQVGKRHFRRLRVT